MGVSRWTRPGVDHLHTAPTLQLDDVCAAYEDGVPALDHISLEVAAGEQVAIVGPNGAGKSTLLNVIAGTLRPQSGTVSIFGHAPGGHICIAYVPQRSQIDWSFPVTVADVVMMGRAGQIGLLRRPRRRDWDVVHDSLARVDALDLSQTQIGALSGGQQQRVFIARALAQEAELLLLDEPLNGLDMPSQEQVFSILDRLRPIGVTVLVSTHDLNLAAARFDRLALLNRRLIAYGRGAAVLQPENLLLAYGGHVHMIPKENGQALLVTNDCCDDHEH